MAMSPAKLTAQARACMDAARAVLPRSLCEGRPADRVLGGYLRVNRQLGSRDRRLIGATLFGVLRWWGWLRFLLPRGRAATPSSADLGRVSPQAWSAVFLGAHVLDCRPPAPVCGIWRKQAGLSVDVGAGTGSGTDLEGRRLALLQCFPHRGLAELSPRDLLPAWVVRELSGTVPVDTLIAWLQRRPPVWFRCQRPDPASLVQALARDGVTAEPHPLVSGALCAAPTTVNLRGTELFRSGGFEIQDLASQAVALICDPRPGESWWDACAGAGGKALHLAWLLGDTGTVFATDRDRRKLTELERRARRAAFRCITVGTWLGDPPRSRRRPFRGVLVDAPCTCSGTWRRNPDGRWRLHPDALAESADAQARLLRNASRSVGPGGQLVYATCSLFSRENEDVVEAFLRGHPSFSPEAFVNPLTGEPCRGMLRIQPWDGDCDAMFVVKLRRS